MNFREQRLSLRDAKEMDLVNYLSSLGHEPANVRHDDFWYHSPLREEHTPSFKVNRRLNKWYDHGMGKGGNLVDFAVLYHHCTVGEVLQQLTQGFSFHTSSVKLPPIKEETLKDRNEMKLIVLGDFPLKSYPLLKYLSQRHIPVEIAQQFCREVRYKINDKTYFGIGFKNDSGAWEIRNPYFKISSSPKDISTFRKGADEVLVFEGFMDFLSYRTLPKNLPKDSQDFVVLNSVSFFERARPFMEQHRSIQLYLDRDATGISCTQRALSLSTKYQDKSLLYQNRKDLNEWLMSERNTAKKRLGRRFR